MARLGVCGWCIERQDAVRSLHAAQGRFDLVQIGFFSKEAVETADPAALRRAAEETGISMVAPFLAFEGESYDSIASIAASGGYAPDEKFEERLALTDRAGAIAAAIGCPAVAVHTCTVPSEPGSALYGKLADRVGRVADVLAARGLELWIETGRESAASLMGFIEQMGRDNIGINFDPGNFVVYGTDDPAAAVAVLNNRLRNVHMKDALPSEAPGEAFGSPALLGQGEARIPRVLSKLRVAGYDGPLLVEVNTRLFGQEALEAGADYLRSML